jgi:hypothetical protein
MNDAAWERLVDSIDIKVGVDRHGRDTRPVEDRPDLSEKVNFVEFEQAGKSFRLERISGPAIIDRKTHFSHRAGAANRIETIYDPDEIAHRVRLLRKDGDEWQEANLNDLSV